jgi:mannose-6-phosphate isomerase-like protein (cupin superfamily)
MPVDAFAQSTQELEDGLKATINPGQPSFFKLGARLPIQGRTDTPVAASENMWVMLKRYAACGESELHAHTNEDHTFVVLQGRATFYGPRGEQKTIGQHEGVLLPAGAMYWFRATDEAPLVMLRIGCASNDNPDRFARIGADGKPLDGFSAANKQVDVVLSDRWFGATP